MSDPVCGEIQDSCLRLLRLAGGPVDLGEHLTVADVVEDSLSRER
jgi:hypothetical protein